MAIIDQALKGKVALVTGGSRGIGRAICIALAGRGAKVIVNYSARADAANETVQLIAQQYGAAGGVEAVAMGFDVAVSGAVTEAIKSIGKDYGGLDILVNNAGVAVNGLLMRFSDEHWQKTMSVNLNGAFHCIRAASTLLMKAKEAGRVINLTSVIGEMGNGGQAAYAASKAGLIGLTMATAREMASRRVTVNAIAPGFIETDMTAAELPEAQRAKLLSEIPLGRIGGPQEIADCAAFLAGPEASYITGQILRVNGGMLM